LALAGCGSDSAAPARDSRVQDAAEDPTTGRDISAEASDAPDATDIELEAISHVREMRGVWIATVSNINWPSQPGLSAAMQQAELDAMFDRAAESGFNAIFFQVRAEADAFYESELEPWSRYLTGTQGEDPGYDPLSYAVDAAHLRGLELHAWLNPYRAGIRRTATFDASHVSERISGSVRTYGNFLWLDPGSAEAEAHTLAVIDDVLTRYDIDGLHFDDYFYPYPTDEVFPDASGYEAYRASGGELDLGDWRRDNVNRMVRRIGERVAELAPDVRFGISPFGIYRPGIPEGIRGLDQYEAIFADPPLWIRQGWVDYLAPQLYWPSTRTAQAYEPLAGWWGELAGEGRSVWAGNFLSQLGTDAEWTVEEFDRQIAMTRASPLSGNIQFQIAPLMANTGGIADRFRDAYYAQPAATPPASNAGSVAPPSVEVRGTTVRLRHEQRLRSYAIYSDGELRQLVPFSTPRAELRPGRYTISAIDRRGAESPGVVVEL
ncbi:MAG: family 10 glycosylhydrolase, partial [Myxococcota bacterium]